MKEKSIYWRYQMMRFPSNMNELIASIKENWMFLVAFVMLMLLIDYVLILKQENHGKVEKPSEEDNRKLLSKGQVIHTEWSLQDLLRVNSDELRLTNLYKKKRRERVIQCFKRKPNYQSKIRRTHHGHQYRRCL